MKQLVKVDRLAQARALLHPIRLELVERLAEPRTCRELSESLGVTQQRLNHHLKELVKLGLVAIERTNRRGNLLEAVYRRTAKAYWLAPELVRAPASRERAEQLSLHNLLVMAETLSADAAKLLDRVGAEEVPSLGFDLELALEGESEREAFTRDLLRAIHQVAERYQGRPGDPRFKVLVSAYPVPDAGEVSR
jgi:DNA-binding transcriptional ArsR family regulator